MRILVLVLCLVAAGCVTSVDTAAPAPAQPTATPTPKPPVDVPRPASTPTPRLDPVGPTPRAGQPTLALELPFAPAPIAALITPTDVPVAVLGEAGDELVVRSPCGRVVTVARAGEELTTVDVVLDPGHGGPIDTGAVGPNGLVERDLNMDVALAARAILEGRGVTVALTRTADYATTLAVRAALADALGSRALVSIHHNAPTLERSSQPGTEVFVQSGSSQSARLGGLIWESVVDALGRFAFVQWTAADDAGVLPVLNSRGTDAYGMIRRPETVTVLVELGYISNASEAALMTSPVYVETAAVALADGIEAFLSDESRAGAGHVAEARIFDPDRAPGEDVCEDPPLR